LLIVAFGDVVAAARAQLSQDLVNRQAAAMDAWHRTGIGNRLREINVPVLIATGTADIVIPPPNALRLVNAIPGAWLAQFNGGGHAFMAQYPCPLADLVNSFLELGYIIGCQSGIDAQRVHAFQRLRIGFA
jgi:pimeloyl-ACP methyl ester carboxylesterase